jgi:hypothetical protein
LVKTAKLDTTDAEVVQENYSYNSPRILATVSVENWLQLFNTLATVMQEN